ncbi:SDR family NAD(P)-dependent oxidoreductase [Nesterenkonia alkaliphila]|uniref:SDR family NAD(P)-dependent oxidoreductase n=1 Tax=Nesterenkonia alkaliphila TaxID=1463631 RepID=A0A7K1UFI4_9MICC|nr:SDR family oxidoreductase [Nesterenkonia alkaliphila]MVT25136.1 SDR family NAD(P)-dependent oxidoreductase [Nesterenkonia alkaliphila]GFZ96929.1 short-chain dehydrogenase [Nesterenkonia alkaliphila]
MDVQSKVFVVTGGGAGIGQATVMELLKRGARVAAVDLNETGLQQTQDRAGAGERLSLHPLNITDREAVFALPDEVISQHGAVDGIINVAGIIQPFVHVKELEFEIIERVMNVNFWGTLNMVKAFLPHLAKRPAASLVNVSSMGAILPVPGQTAYGASKAAVRLLTEGLYAELQGTSVHVTEVFPGAVGTDITKNSGVERSGGTSKDKASAKTTSPEEAGRQIVEAVEAERFRLHIGKDAKLFDRLSRLMPEKAIRKIAEKMKGVG